MCSSSNTTKRICKLCGTKVSGNAMFCSDDCYEGHYDYILVDVSRRWVVNTLLKIDCPERYNAIVAYGKRHSFSLKLLKKKLVEKFNVDICKGY